MKSFHLGILFQKERLFRAEDLQLPLHIIKQLVNKI
jgi:hypothetical protein